MQKPNGLGRCRNDPNTCQRLRAVVLLWALFGAKGSTPTALSIVTAEIMHAKPQKVMASMIVLVLVLIVVQVGETAEKG